MKKFIFSIFLCCLMIPMVNASSKNDNLVNVYLFYSDSCSYCNKERKLFNELKDKYENLNVYEYNVADNMELFEEVSDLYNTDVTGVPCVFVGDKVYKGYSYTESKRKLMAVIDYYSRYGYRDIVGEYVGNIMLPRNDIDNDIDIDKYISDYGNFKISILNIDTDDLSLGMMSLISGIVDGINISMIMLILSLLSIIIMAKGKKEMWIILTSCLLVVLVSYFILIVGNINVNSFILNVINALLLLFIGCFRLIEYFYKKKVCNKLYLFLNNKRFWLELISGCLISFLGVILFSKENSVFSSVIELYDLVFIERIIYNFIYVFCYIIIYLVILFLLVFIIQKKNLNVKYERLFLFSSSVCLILVGVFDLIYKLC